MSNKPSLTEQQRTVLAHYEPKLQAAALKGEYEKAKEYAAHIIRELKNTPHQTRLLQNKLWLFEAAMEAGHVEMAISGFTEIRKRTNIGTRVHLESVAFLSICHIKSRRPDDATPFINYVLNNTNHIATEQKRLRFKMAYIKRLEDEALIANVSGSGKIHDTPAEIETEAGKLIAKHNSDEILAILGESTPTHAFEYLKKVHDISKKQLPYQERIGLPTPPNKGENANIGKRVLASLGRVLWRYLCDKDNEINKVLFVEGLKGVLNKHLLGFSIISAFNGFEVGNKIIAVSTTALIIKIGVDVFCEEYRPEKLMDTRQQRKQK